MKKILGATTITAGLIGLTLLMTGLKTNNVMMVADNSTAMSETVRIESDIKVATTSIDSHFDAEVLQRVDNEPAGQALNKQNLEIVKATQDAENSNIGDPEVKPDPEKVLQDFITSGDPEGIRRVYAERRKARAELVKAQMDNEQVDVDWTEDLSKRFEFARNLMPELAEIRLSQADCRKTICSLHIAYAGRSYQQYSPFLAQVGIVLGADAWVHHDAFPDGGVVYVARENIALPTLERQQL